MTAAQNGSVGYNAPPNSGSSGLQCGGENGDGAAVLGVQEVSAGGSSSIITLSTPPTPAKKVGVPPHGGRGLPHAFTQWYSYGSFGSYPVV